MGEPLIDLTFGIKRQERAVAQLLSDEYLPDGWFARTAPWYNCRECGIVLSVAGHAQSFKALHIAFFEHRNHDGICALRWEADYGVNPPTITDSGSLAYPTDSKWDVTHTVECGRADLMAKWIWNQVETFIDGHEAARKEGQFRLRKDA